MQETTRSPVSISIDLKKYRIRIYKSMLHILGDPPYILLLVNPKKRYVAIKGSDLPASDGLTHKVPRDVLLSDNSVEIYSQTLIKKLRELSPGLDPGNLYRMSGQIIYQENMAIFSLDTLTRI